MRLQQLLEGADVSVLGSSDQEIQIVAARHPRTLTRPAAGNTAKGAFVKWRRHTFTTKSQFALTPVAGIEWSGSIFNWNCLATRKGFTSRSFVPGGMGPDLPVVARRAMNGFTSRR